MTDSIYAITERDLGDEVRLEFIWHGGQYIDVRAVGLIDHPSEVINVWNSYTDQPTIERADDAFHAKVDEWIEEYPADALKHDVLVNWS